MKMTTRAIVWTIAAIVAVVGLLLTGGYLWLNSNQARGLLTARINAAIPGRIAIQSHRLSILDARLDLFGVALYGSGNDHLAAIEHVAVDAAWWPLIRRELRIEAMVVAAPRMNLALDTAGRLNLMEALMVPGATPTPSERTAAPAIPVNIVLSALRLSGGQLSFTTPQNAGAIAASGIDITASGDLAAGRATLDLRTADIHLAMPGLHLQPMRLGVQAELNDGTLTVTHGRLTAGQSSVTIEGRTTELFASPQVDGHLTLTGPLAELISATDLAVDMDGLLNAELQIKGAAANPDANLAVGITGARFSGVSMDRVDARLHLTDRRLILEGASLEKAAGTIRIDGTGDLREAFPSGFTSPPADLDTIAYELRLVPQIPDLAPWLTPLAKLGGSADGRLTISGRGVHLPTMTASVTAIISGKDLTAPELEQPVNARLSLSGRVANGSMAAEELALISDGIQLSGSGRYRPDDGSVAGRLAIAIDDLSRSIVVAGLPQARGSVRATIELGGTLARPQFSAQLATHDLGSGAITLGDLSAAARMTPDGRVTVDTLVLKNGSSRVSGNARLRLPRDGKGRDPDADNVVDLRLEAVSIADFVANPTLGGRFDGRLQVGGTVATPAGSLTLNGREIKVRGIDIDDLSTSLEIADGRLTIDRLQLTRQAATASLSGTVALLAPDSLHLAPDPAIDLSLVIAQFNPAAVYPVPVSGQFAVDASLTGSLKAPTGRFHLAGRDLDLAGQSVRRLDAAGLLQDQRVWLNTFVAEIAPDARLTLDGSIGLDRTLDLAARATKIPVASIHTLRDIAPAGGRLDLVATARGALANPDIDGQLTVSDMAVGGQRMDDIHLDIHLQDMQARIGGRLNFAVDARCDLRGGDFSGRLDFDRTDLAAYFKAAGLPDWGGVVSGQVVARGNYHHLADAAATMDISQFELHHDDTQLVHTDRIALELAAGVIRVSPATLTLFTTGRMDIKGRMDLDGPLDITLDGELPLADLGLLTDRLGDVAGSLALSGHLTGETRAPQVDARIEMVRVAMTLPETGQRLHDLTGRLTLNDRRLTIDRLTGRLDTGTFILDGSLDHDHWTPTRVDLTVQARTLPIDVPDTLSLLLNGDIRLTGSDRRATARGEIIILEGLYDRDVTINLLQLAAARKRRVKPESPPLTIPYFDTVDLDIDVGYRQPFLVENNLAQLEITPDLNVGGTLARPILSGRAQVKDGTLTFQGKTFTVNKGVIDFINPYKTEATIDIESQATISTWTVFLVVQGTPDTLDLKLSSIPEQSDADILSIILFGKPASALTAGEGGGQRTTGQIMAEMLADTFGEDIKERTGVDILEVTASENGSAATGDTQATDGVTVTVGKHLSDRMTVKYAVETKSGDVVQRAITEYQLLEYFLVSGFQDSQGVYGSELVFRLEFR